MSSENRPEINLVASRFLAGAFFSTLFFTGCSTSEPQVIPAPSKSETPTTIVTSPPANRVVQTRPTARTLPTSVLSSRKNHDCVIMSGLPDHDCSPGVAFPNVTEADVCKPGYAGETRDVSELVKNAVYAEYNISQHFEGQYEIDHIISLELGGSNDIGNLFPEAAEPFPGFHEKDMVENFLHDQVCKNGLALKVAQAKISGNWFEVYIQIPTPTPRPARRG